jgi:arylsulfatase A-like enzyme
VPTPDFVGRSKTTEYGDFVMQTDALLGRVMTTLEEAGVGDNTLVIFTSDNGFAPAADLEGLRVFNHDPSGGYRGHKADIYEGGHRVPFVARWPGHVPAGTTCAAPIGQVDLLATCAEMLGVDLPDHAGEDSVSMLDVLMGADAPRQVRPPLVHHSALGAFAIREGRWKLCLCRDSGGWSHPRPASTARFTMPPFQLFDLEADPSETTNLAAVHPDEVRRLGRRLLELVDHGRSTHGAPQANDAVEAWPQLAWREAWAD